MKYRGPYNVLSTLLFAATLSLLAGCTSDDDIINVHEGTAPLTLDANVNTAVTRSGGTGNITYSVLAKYGFGVFAYGGVNWENQKVVWYDSKTSADELGDVHEHTANWTYGDEILWDDKEISFLAYAPYVLPSSSSESSTTGITKVEGSNVDDTKVTYTIATNPVEGVDLLWGVREDANEKGQQRMPWLNTSTAAGSDVWNVTKGGVTFSFHHALTAIGFHVQAMIDKDNDLGDYEDESNVGGILGEDGNYKITLKDITLSGNFHKQAVLNLNNTKAGIPNWGGYSGSETTLTVGNGNINAAFRHGNDAATGVSQQAEQLVIARKEGTNAEQCFFVIPNETMQDYTLVLEWYVNDEPHINEIEIENWALRPETKYYINLVIGLKSVRLNVTATDWKGNPIDIEDIFEDGTSADKSLVKKK